MVSGLTEIVSVVLFPQISFKQQGENQVADLSCFIMAHLDNVHRKQIHKFYTLFPLVQVQHIQAWPIEPMTSRS